MTKIEFKLNDLKQWSLGIYKMKREVTNIIIEDLDSLEIGFLFFSILIYF